MELYLLRHGIAADHAPSGRDADRALTARGARKLRDVIARARLAGVSPDQIVSSPYRRAIETARIAADGLAFPGPLIESASLTPGSSPEAAWDALRPFRDSASILIVGHNPLWSDLYAYLLNSPTLAVDVKKGSLGCIELPASAAAPRGILRWLITPAWCDSPDQ